MRILSFLFLFVLEGGGGVINMAMKWNFLYDLFMHSGISSTTAPFYELMFENIKQWQQIKNSQRSIKFGFRLQNEV